MLLDREQALEMIAALDRHAWAIAHRAVRRTRAGDVEDYYRAAVAGMWEAATRFDPARGDTFGCYAQVYARKWVRRLVRNEASRGVHVPDYCGVRQLLVVPLGSIGEDGDRPFDVPAPDRPAPPPEPGPFWRAVRRLIPDARHRDAVVWYYRDGQQDKDIAARVGIVRRSATGRRTAGEACIAAFGADCLMGDD